MNYRILLSFISVLFFSFSLNGQSIADNIYLQQVADSLKPLGLTILKSKTDEEKTEANSRYLSILNRALSKTESFEFGFDSVKTMAVLISPDKRFKIYNWNLPKTNGTFEYYGFIQVWDKKNKSTKVFKLNDKSATIKNPETASLDADNWYGAHYYKIIESKHKRKTNYLLLGWKGNDRLTTKKVIETMTIDNQLKPKFGVALFKVPKKNPKRFVFEYSADVTMSVKYDEKERMIIFDHLSPTSSNLKGQYQYYSPDMSYDALRFRKGVWELIEDFEAKNLKGEKEKIFNQPK